MEEKIVGHEEIQKRRGQGVGCKVTKNDNKHLGSEKDSEPEAERACEWNGITRASYLYLQVSMSETEVISASLKPAPPLSKRPRHPEPVCL